jgi:hypothetical protein
MKEDLVKKSLAVFRNPWVHLFLSVFLAFLMVFTLFPHEVLSQEMNQNVSPSWSFQAEEKEIPAAKPLLESPEVDVAITALDITSTSANLRGTLTSLGPAESVQVYFEYGEDDNYRSITDAAEIKNQGPFTIHVEGLKP